MDLNDSDETYCSIGEKYSLLKEIEDKVQDYIRKEQYYDSTELKGMLHEILDIIDTSAGEVFVSRANSLKNALKCLIKEAIEMENELFECNKPLSEIINEENNNNQLKDQNNTYQVNTIKETAIMPDNTEVMDMEIIDSNSEIDDKIQYSTNDLNTHTNSLESDVLMATNDVDLKNDDAINDKSQIMESFDSVQFDEADLQGLINGLNNYYDKLEDVLDTMEKHFSSSSENGDISLSKLDEFINQSDRNKISYKFMQLARHQSIQ